MEIPSPGAVQQLKMLPRVNTSHFLHPSVDVSPYFNASLAKKKVKQNWLRRDLNLKNCTSKGQKICESYLHWTKTWKDGTSASTRHQVINKVFQ